MTAATVIAAEATALADRQAVIYIDGMTTRQVAACLRYMVTFAISDLFKIHTFNVEQIQTSHRIGLSTVR